MIPAGTEKALRFDPTLCEKVGSEFLLGRLELLRRKLYVMISPIHIIRLKAFLQALGHDQILSDAKPCSRP